MDSDRDGVVMASVYHRTVDGGRLFAVRLAMGVSQAAFAERCGHSQQFQQRIEAEGQHEVLASRAEAIAAALAWFEQNDKRTRGR
jgi:transcriptional regulator with XRE-family HTH domain